MKALSIQQPWAWLIANDFKDIENRSWSTKFRGEFLIHAGKKFDKESYEYIKETHPEIKMPEIEYLKLETGGIIGMAEIRDCVSKSNSKWFCGEYGFVIKNAHPINFIPYKGQLGFFEVGFPG